MATAAPLARTPAGALTTRWLAGAAATAPASGALDDSSGSAFGGDGADRGGAEDIVYAGATVASPARAALNASGVSTNTMMRRSSLPREALPEQVARLAAANATLMSSLKQAHADLAAMLIERDELNEALRSAEDAGAECMELTASWVQADAEWVRQRTHYLRQCIQDTKMLRAAMHDRLKLLHAGTA